ncbi:MAG: hypothetical protein ACOYOA_15130, partial [Saprospiraceae bacterium]
ERQKEKFPLGNVFEKTSDIYCEIPTIKIATESSISSFMPQHYKHQFYFLDKAFNAYLDSCFHPPSQV